MTALKDKIVRLIEASGPISVSDYMALCLFDPEHGYYTTKEPFGAAGDFITAPEVSQMFGELVAVWLFQAWQAIGAPRPFTQAELGPGRGTLMKDMLRTLQRLDPTLLSGADVAMVEISPRLQEIQKAALAASPARPCWHREIRELRRRPLVVVGNELFDAIPIRQYVRTASGWRERAVALDEKANLQFIAGAGAPDPALLPLGAETALPGTIAEIAPARGALMEEVAERIAADGGAGLFIDYGHAAPALGDTLQALSRHKYQDVLAAPGEADLTTHVDFAALSAAARSAGLDANVMKQGDFLLRMGLIERAGALGRTADEATRERLQGEVERLAGPQAMGELFKVLAVLPRGIAVPPFG